MSYRAKSQDDSRAGSTPGATARAQMFALAACEEHSTGEPGYCLSYLHGTITRNVEPCPGFVATIVHAVELLSSSEPAEIEEARRAIRRQARTLSRLIDDLLDVSRITRGQVTLDGGGSLWRTS